MPESSIDKAYSKGKAAGSGFITSRINAVMGGAADIGLSGVRVIPDTLGMKEMSSPGVLGVMRDTAFAVGHTVAGSDRSMLWAKKGTRTWGQRINPFDHLRRLAAGATEIAAEGLGGPVGVISARAGKAVENAIRGAGRISTGWLVGDFKNYLNYEDAQPFNSQVGEKTLAAMKKKPAAATPAATPAAPMQGTRAA